MARLLLPTSNLLLPLTIYILDVTECICTLSLCYCILYVTLSVSLAFSSFGGGILRHLFVIILLCVFYVLFDITKRCGECERESKR